MADHRPPGQPRPRGPCGGAGRLYDEGRHDEGAAVWAGAGGVLAACEKVLADVGRFRGGRAPGSVRRPDPL